MSESKKKIEEEKEAAQTAAAEEKEEAKTLLPEFLLDSISDYRKAIRKDSTLVDCYSDQLNSSINVAEVEHLISKEVADRLRARYFKR